MGQYSLENYEPYKTVKCRPDFRTQPGRILRYLDVEWSANESLRRNYSYPVPDFAQDHVIWLIRLAWKTPGWSGGGAEDAAEFIRRAGSFYSGYPRLGGVLIGVPKELRDSQEALWAAYAEAFAPLWSIVHCKDPQLVQWLQERHHSFGVLLEGEGSWIAVREFLARHQLQRAWEHSPVYASVQKNREEDQAESLCGEFHVTAAEGLVLQGPQLIPRRVTFPAAVSAGGALPVRLWWDNCGDSPLYGCYTTFFCLRGGAEAELALSDRRADWGLGDSTYHEILALPRLPSGSYGVYIRVEDQYGWEVPLSIHAAVLENERGRWYYLGHIAIDVQPRPEMYGAWDHYYPEGYYPLEDPAQPESQEGKSYGK